MGDNWETQKHMSNEGRYMAKGSSTKGRGSLSTMPALKFRPALVKVSEARVNGSTARGSVERPKGK